MNEVPRQGLVVLNVDDDEPSRYAKGRVLAEGGYSVLAARTGPEALDLARTRHPDVIVLDVGLPGLDGFEVCRRLKAAPETSSIPIVQVSASFVQASDRVRALEGGADTYLTEPIDPRVLVATVGAMVRLRDAESALRASEARFRQMADAAPVLIWLAGIDKACTWCNRRWFEFTGGGEADLADAWTQGIHRDDVDRVSTAFDAAFTSRSEFQLEYRRRRVDGEDRWVLDHGVPIYEGGEFAGYIGSSIDITDRRFSENERDALLARERAAREHSERVNRVKDEFLATLGHELRTPLNAMLGWAQVLATGQLGAEEATQAVERITRNGRAQARIIEDLLDMSRIISGKVRLSIKPVDVRQVVVEAIEAVSPAASAKNVSIERAFASDPCVIDGDGDRVQQVVWNLLTNAIKFSPVDGRVRVALRETGRMVECEIEDEGQGIDPAFLPHVFERFRQADATPARIQGGLGLGLAIVKHLVELHGGEVRAFSDGEGHGARFTLRFPIARSQPLDQTAFHAAAAPAIEEPQAPEPTALQGLHVLVVDDDVDARDLMGRILRARGASAVIASSGEEGLERLREERFDLIVSDIAMPKFDGYEFMRRVRGLEKETNAHVPALALTAFARHEDRQLALKAGYEAHLAKPIDAAALVTTLSELLRT